MEGTDFAYQEPIHSMYLSTLTNQKTLRPHTAVRDTMKVDDISGARSKFVERPIKHRETWNNCNDDIARSKPKILIPTEVNKQSYNMYTDDIQGTKPKLNKFVTTRNTNPLCPVYEIPLVQYYPVEEPKFVRDNMITYDIDGTSTKESFAMRLEKQGKVLNNKEEILKSIQLKKKNNLRKSQNLTFLDPSDINLKYSHVKGSRHTNPLDPHYVLPNSDEIGGTYVTHTISKSKTPQPQHLYNNPNYSLETKDIPGAQTKVNNFFVGSKQDIKQSHAESHKRGIHSNRKTNPLNPSYNYPGWSQGFGCFSSQRPKTAHQRFDAFIK